MSTVSPQINTLKDGRTLHIRTATAADAHVILDHVHAVSAESDYLNFVPGEFELTEAQEADYLAHCATADNQLYIVGLIDGQLVGTLNFTAGRRARVRHSGEFSLSVRQAYWGLGVGGFMMNAFIDWARTTIRSPKSICVCVQTTGAVSRSMKRRGLPLKALCAEKSASTANILIIIGWDCCWPEAIPKTGASG